MMSSILRFILDQSVKQWLTGGKRAEDDSTKMLISWE